MLQLKFINNKQQTMRKIVFLSTVLTMALLSSCAKTEGLGGTSEITGKVYIYEYTSGFTILKQEYFAPEEDVYIVYGDDVVYNDSFETHYDGTFRFQYLRTGKYTIYVYSDDKENPLSLVKVPVIREVEITENNQTIDLGTIEIYKD